MNTEEMSIAQRIVFDYEKSSHFRVVHADGAHGGVSPDSSGVLMCFYSERRPIPRREVYQTSGDRLAPIHEATVARDCDVLREVEVCVQMDLGAARQLMGWLSERIKQAEKAQAFLSSKLNENRP